MGTAPAGQPAPSTPSAPQSTPATQGATTTPTPSSATPPGADSGWPPGAKEAAQAAGAAAQKAREKGKPLPEVCDPSKKAYWERADIKAWAEANPELAKRLKEKEGFRDSPPSNRTQELEKIPNNGETSPAWARRAAEVAAQPGGNKTLGSLTITSTPVPATSPTGGAQTAASHNVTVSMGTHTAQFSVGPDGKIRGVTGAVAEVNRGIEKQNKERATSPQGPAQPQTGGQSHPPAATQVTRVIKPDGTITLEEQAAIIRAWRSDKDEIIARLPKAGKEGDPSGTVNGDTLSIKGRHGPVPYELTINGKTGEVALNVNGRPSTNPAYLKFAEEKIRDLFRA